MDDRIVHFAHLAELLNCEMIVVGVAKVDSRISTDINVRTCFRAILRSSRLQRTRRSRQLELGHTVGSCHVASN